MKKLKPALVFGFLGIATFASLVGTVSGTLAWYAYNARTTLSYSGTSVENSVQLQIGLACAHEMVADGSDEMDDFLATMNEPEVIDGVYYYFAPLGYGLNSSVINAYLSEFGYATNELEPITSGYFDPAVHHGFSPKAAPNADNPSLINAAQQANYLRLPFIFRASKSKTDTADYIKDAEIWLTDAKGAASSNHDGNVYKAMRIFFDRNDTDYDTDFIVNPDANAAGETKVGGLLDLTMDGYYDFDGTKEVIYGEWNTSALADPTTLLNDPYEAPAGGAPYYDLNGTGDTVASGNTFNSRHHDNVEYYDYSDINNIPFRTAKYESLGSVKPTRDPSTGKLSNPLVQDPAHPDDPTQKITKVTSVCKTKGSEMKYIGRVDAYIWLEGWDFHVIDEEQHHSFDLGLTFEINKASNNS